MSLPGLFVIGTDTGVGKTRVAAAIARSLTREGHRVGVLKPVATGAVRLGDGWRVEDADLLIEAIGGGDLPRERVVPLVFEEPLAPSVAARRLGISLKLEQIAQAALEALAWWAERAEVVVVEGVGGLLTPIAEDATVADLAIALDYPLVIVAPRGLGTLNHTLLTVEAARRRGLRVAGIVLNSVRNAPETLAEATNADELARHLDGTAVLAELEFHDDPATLSFSDRAVDWYHRAEGPRHASEPHAPIRARGD